MSIDLEKELKFMAVEYDLTEKQVLNWWRSAVRQMWANSPFKRHMEYLHQFEVVNDNPRSMKRYPIVKRMKCEKCNNIFSPSAMELDHIIGENKAESLADAENFMKAILFTPKDNLQWLCADGKKTVNKKRVTSSIGCHSRKTQLESNPSLSEHEAWAIREVKRIVKYENLLDKLTELGVESIPKLKKEQEALLYKLMVEDCSE